ncbi:MAG: helix-hairpin-helix domain-containing protein [Ignavibacteria bacterium]|nr:helix-hairpin-helix domain-containing protein [Ignavibacteria bacterium]
MFSLKDLSPKNYLTKNEIRVLSVILGLGGVGIGVNLFNSWQASKNNQFEKTNIDSIFTEIFRADSVQKINVYSSDSLRSMYFKVEQKSKKDELKPGSININTASKSDLTKLPGIGEKTADRIIEYRTNVKRFKSKDDLMNVKGIGQKKFEALKEFITLK